MHAKKIFRLRSEKPSALFTHRQGQTENGAGEKKVLVLGQDYEIVRLCAENVSSNKSNVKKEGKCEGEALFRGMLGLLADNFPPSEVESEPQFRRYLFDRFAKRWFVEVAADKRKNVIGASLYSYCPAADVVMYNIVAVAERARWRGVATQLVSSMVRNGDRISHSEKGYGITYVLGEIEQPIFNRQLDEASLAMRNRIRPAFHDSVSLLRAIRLPNGEPLSYILPIIASDSERREAEAKGKPLTPEQLLFCLRPVARTEGSGIPARKTGELLLWFYKDYLEAECSDVKREEANALLALTLAKLTTEGGALEIIKLLEGGRKNDKKIIRLIPQDQRLSFMKISETAA